MTIEGLDSLYAKLDAMGKAADNNEPVIVGYSQKYALIVHENLTAHHKEGKQAKYLETPARAYVKQIANIVAEVYKKTKNLTLAKLAGGLFLLRKSQEIVPVDTAALKASGYVAVESKAEAAAQDALSASEAVRSQSLLARSKKK